MTVSNPSSASFSVALTPRQATFLRRLLSALACLVLPISVGGCPAETSGCQAASDCGQTTGTCSGCPEEASSLCEEGTCLDRFENAVDVVANVNIDRGVASQVASLVHVIIAKVGAKGPITCDTAFSAPGHVSSEANVLAAGYKALSGGSYHDGVTLGRVPEGEVLLLVWGTTQNTGEGDVVASGCVEDLLATAPDLALELVQMDP